MAHTAKFVIEHVMPRKWQAHWPLTDPGVTDESRDRIIHTIGNLTLLTGKLSAKVSNGPWIGPNGKQSALAEHDALFLNRQLLRMGDNDWSEDRIARRTDELVNVIVAIWPVPEGHRSGFAHDKARPTRHIDLADLLSAGHLAPGITLQPRPKAFAHRLATLLPDGRIDVDGVIYDSPSRAAKAIRGKATGGWGFFLVDSSTGRSLRDVRREYMDDNSVESDDDDDDDAEDDA